MSGRKVLKYTHEANGLTARVAIHDQFHVEFQCNHEVPASGEKRTYASDAYWFVPRQLGFNQKTFTAHDFLCDSKMYARLEPVELEFKDFLKPQQALAYLQTQAQHVTTLQHQLQVELCDVSRNFAASFSSAAKKSLQSACAEDQLPEDQARLCEQFLKDVNTLVSAFDEFLPQYVVPMASPLIRKNFIAVRAFLSFELEVMYGKLMDATDNDDIKSSIAAAVEAERQERERHHTLWCSLLGSKQHREHIWSDYSLFKKIVLSCLHLHDYESRMPWTLSELVLGLAAAGAMAFALFIAVVSTAYYPIYSMPWVMIAVVAYMLKDRIKEFLRAASLEFIQPFVCDRKIFLHQPGQKKWMATQTEHLSFPDIEKMDLQARELRLQVSRSIHMLLPDAEEVMCMHRRIVMRNPRALNNRQDLTTILRFDIRRLLARMDDPHRWVQLVDSEHMQTNRTKIPNVYHVPLVIRYTCSGEEGLQYTYQALRLVLDRKGIRRLEPLESDQRSWAKITEWDMD